MRIWDEFVSDDRGTLRWSVGKQGRGLSVFEVSSNTFSSSFAVPHQRKGVANLRRDVAEKHRRVLEEIALAALHEGSAKKVERLGMDDPHYRIEEDAFRRLAAERGYDWRS